ncbi:anti-sigma factor family protein [Ekhidna sp.]|uniref:anti-sigma factor family protein n=1 Tax=Ekhidna sp. TaxID=2608089 RepID=UPI003B59AB65
MSYKPEESTLIAYLYGELSEEEKDRVEQYLSEHNEARMELNGMKEVLGIMGHAKDREVETPVFSFNNPSKVIMDTNSNGNWWRYPLGIAASIALLMVVGYLTSFKVSSEEGHVKIAFGEQESVPEEIFTKDQVKEMISLALNENNKLVNQKLAEAKSDLITQANQQAPIELDQQLLNNYIQRLRQYNAETMAGLLEESELEQRRYTDQVLQDFAIFLDLQRQDDMELIQSRIQNISEDTERFNRQTGQILTSLLSTDETQNNNQY